MKNVNYAKYARQYRQLIQTMQENSADYGMMCQQRNTQFNLLEKGTKKELGFIREIDDLTFSSELPIPAPPEPNVTIVLIDGNEIQITVPMVFRMFKLRKRNE